VPDGWAVVARTAERRVGPGSTLNGKRWRGVRASRLVRFAVRATPLCALVYVTPPMVIWLAPAGIVPATVPPRAPSPAFRARVTPVGLETARGAPATSRACTITAKRVPATGWRPAFTELMASVDGGVEPPVTAMGVAS